LPAAVVVVKGHVVIQQRRRMQVTPDLMRQLLDQEQRDHQPQALLLVHSEPKVTVAARHLPTVVAVVAVGLVTAELEARQIKMDAAIQMAAPFLFQTQVVVVGELAARADSAAAAQHMAVQAAVVVDIPVVVVVVVHHTGAQVAEVGPFLQQVQPQRLQLVAIKPVMD
jgi:hypothetical protein